MRGGGGLAQAEPPYLATANHKHEWNYGQKKHQAALDSVKGLVDQTTPRSISVGRLGMQAKTRRFCEDQRRAEIGRENRKIVDKLTGIARGAAGHDLRGPPPRPRLAASLPASRSLGVIEPTRSLIQGFHEQEQRRITSENAQLVRRIVAVKPSFNRGRDQQDFQRHHRNVHLLQRLPESTGGTRSHSRPSSLPPLRPPRPNARDVPSGLQGLLLPSDLQRCGSVPGSFGHNQLRSKPPSPASPAIQSRPHALTAPVASACAANSQASSPRANPPSHRSSHSTNSSSRNGRGRPGDAPSQRPSSSYSSYRSSDDTGSLESSDGIRRRSNSQSASTESTSEVEVFQTESPQLQGIQSLAQQQPPADAAAWPVESSAPERRQWLADEQGVHPGPVAVVGLGAPDASRADPRSSMTGMSVDSGIQYAEDWDDYSMSNEATPKPRLTRGTSFALGLGDSAGPEKSP